MDEWLGFNSILSTQVAAISHIAALYQFLNTLARPSEGE